MITRFIGGINIKQLQNTINICKSNNWIPILDYAKEGSVNITDVLVYMTNILQLQGLSPTYALKLSSFKPFEPYNNMDYIISILKDSGANKIFLDAETIELEEMENDIYNRLIMKYNKEETFLYKTYQMYKKNNTLDNDIKTLPNLGIKLVRGAYLEKDISSGKLFENIKDTHNNYNTTMQRIVELNIPVVAATHNIETIERFKNDNNIEFAQLLGMKDDYSYELAKTHNVYKYIPYGRPYDLMPYVIRRLNENKSIIRHIF